MRVILKDNVENLGNVGDIVDVRSGYAHNFLLPKGLVLVATEGNVAAQKHLERVIADRIRKLKLSAQGVAKQMEGIEVEVSAKAGETDRLFGSIGNSDIQKALKAKGFGVNRRDVQLEKPLKSLGVHEVDVRLHPEVTVKVKVSIVRTREEAAAMAAKRSRTQDILEAVAREEAAKKAAEAAAEAAEEAEAAGEAKEEKPAE